MSPLDWRVADYAEPYLADNYRLVSDFNDFWEGRASASLTTFQAGLPISTVQACNADRFQGSRIRYSAYLKTENVSGLQASIWIRAQEAETGRVVAFQNMAGRLVAGDTDWAAYEMVLDLPDQDMLLLYGATVWGIGTLWVDDMLLERVDPSYPLTGTPFDRQVMNVPFEIQRDQPANTDFEGVLRLQVGIED